MAIMAESMMTTLAISNGLMDLPNTRWAQWYTWFSLSWINAQ